MSMRKYPFTEIQQYTSIKKKKKTIIYIYKYNIYNSKYA